MGLKKTHLRHKPVEAILREQTHKLNERVKELMCLYGIAQIVERREISIKEFLQKVVGLIPPAWQYPEITFCMINLDGCFYSTDGFQKCEDKQTTNIIINKKKRGFIEVVYTKKKPEADEGPFLKEERKLINVLAKQIALIIERKESEEQKSNLQGQLRHADRLATIGQLSAGIAHELNEPLGNILGFAQLVKKSSGLPEQTEQDITKIITISLSAREIIKKLMLFSRQIPPKKTLVNLNQVVTESLSFFESRCAKAGIEVSCSLSPNLPEFIADQGQLTQVIVNLAVNAIQAMPEGGRLTIQTLYSKDYVSLIVEDTGIGMSQKVMKQIFVPFFTTKDVNEGTGLGLAVAYGIISSHEGSIKVKSNSGIGTQFKVQLPLKTH